MQRNKFQTRQFLLRSQQQVEAVIALVGNLPIESNFPLEVVLREPVKARGLDQNGLYWKRVGEIAEQGWLEGRQYSKDIWHQFLAKYEMPEEVEIKDGSKRSKWESMPDGTQAAISTTMLSMACFAEYTTIVTAFGASLGVHFSARDYGIR